jgi:TolB-like protein
MKQFVLKQCLSVSLLLIPFSLSAIPLSLSAAHAAANAVGYPTAILPFKARGGGLEAYGPRVADALFAVLAAYSEIDLVDRKELKTVINEQGLNLSGMVNNQQAVQIGQLIGAKLMITGTITEFDTHLILVAKVIGTETSRVLGESVKGQAGDDLLPLVEALGEKVARLVKERSIELVAAPDQKADPVKRINAALGKQVRPTLTIDVIERHVGSQTLDPAAETELLLLCQKTGFTTIDKDSPAAKRSDILIKGEGFSEFAARRGDLVSVKARLEVKALDQITGKIIAVDRQTGVAVDLSEQIAGKKALEQAATELAVRLLPLLVAK